MKKIILILTVVALAGCVGPRGHHGKRFAYDYQLDALSQSESQSDLVLIQIPDYQIS